MEDINLTSEWLDALDAIDNGDLKPAIELLIGANPPPEVIVSKLRNLVADEKVRFPIVKPGRPTGASSFSLSQSTELSQLQDFLSKHSSTRDNGDWREQIVWLKPCIYSQVSITAS